MPNPRFEVHLGTPDHGSNVTMGGTVAAAGDFHVHGGVHNEAVLYFEAEDGAGKRTSPVVVGGVGRQRIRHIVADALDPGHFDWNQVVNVPSSVEIPAGTAILRLVVEVTLNLGSPPPQSPYRSHTVVVVPVHRVTKSSKKKR